jgi:hypothetical protein
MTANQISLYDLNAVNTTIVVQQIPLNPDLYNFQLFDLDAVNKNIILHSLNVHEIFGGLTESLSLTDTENDQLTTNANASESATLTDTESVTNNAFAQESEFGAATDTEGGNYTTNGSISEPLSGSDTLSSSLLALGDLVEALTASESVSDSLGTIGDVVEAMGAIDINLFFLFTNANDNEPLNANTIERFVDSQADCEEDLVSVDGTAAFYFAATQIMEAQNAVDVLDAISSAGENLFGNSKVLIDIDSDSLMITAIEGDSNIISELDKPSMINDI